MPAARYPIAYATPDWFPLIIPALPRAHLLHVLLFAIFIQLMQTALRLVGRTRFADSPTTFPCCTLCGCSSAIVSTSSSHSIDCIIFPFCVPHHCLIVDCYSTNPSTLYTTPPSPHHHTFCICGSLRLFVPRRWLLVIYFADRFVCYVCLTTFPAAGPALVTL